MANTHSVRFNALNGRVNMVQQADWNLDEDHTLNSKSGLDVLLEIPSVVECCIRRTVLEVLSAVVKRTVLKVPSAVAERTVNELYRYST